MKLTPTLSALTALLLGVASLATPIAQAQPTPETPAQSETAAAETDEDDAEVADQPDPQPAAAPQKLTIGGRNISALTRKNLYGGSSIGGYFDTEYFFPDGKSAFFDNHRLILQVSSLLHERIFFNTEIEFEHGGVLGGGSNDGELKIEQGYLDFKLEDWLIFRGGAILVPMGRLNVLHDSDFRDTTTRPLFTNIIVPSTWTEPGAGLYGTLYPDEQWEVFYEAYVLQGLSDNLQDGSGLRRARPSLSKDNNNSKAVTARVGLSPFIGLDFGLGGYYSAFDAEARKHLGLFVADLNWRHGPFELVGEGGVAFHTPTTYSAGNQQVALNGPMWGYYLEGHYHFFPEVLTSTWLGEGLPAAVFTLVGRVSQVDTDASVLNQNDRTELILGLNYRPTPNTVFKLEYQWNLENQAFLTGDMSRELNNNQLIASVAVGF
jgi:hypothetical protein